MTDDFDDDGLCIHCGDDDGDRQLMNGDWVCDDCLVSLCDDLLTELEVKHSPGPATRLVMEQAKLSLTHEIQHVPSGRIMVDLPADVWRLFLAEMEGE